MSNEKMREDFEAWYSEQFKYSDKKLTRHGDTYLSPFVAGLWMSWQASRAALCVDVPEFGPGYADARLDVFIDDLYREFESIGILYK